MASYAAATQPGHRPTDVLQYASAIHGAANVSPVLKSPSLGQMDGRAVQAVSQFQALLGVSNPQNVSSPAAQTFSFNPNPKAQLFDTWLQQASESPSDSTPAATSPYDRRSSANSIDRGYCSNKCIAVMIAVSTVALVTINILALYGYFNTQTLSIINTSVLGTASLLSLVALRKSNKQQHKLALLTTCVVLIACAGLSTLGIFKVFNTTSVTWTVFAPLIAASGLALVMGIILGLDAKEDKKKRLASCALAITIVALIALNIVAMKGHLNAATIGIINTTIFGSIALLFASVLFADDVETKGKIFFLAIFLIFGTMASLASLGIAGHFSATSVGWTLFVPIITVVSIVVLAGCCSIGCSLASK